MFLFNKTIKLPVGVSEYEDFCQKIIKVAGPIADERSMKFVISLELMHWPNNDDKVPISYFVNRLRIAAAKQVAAYKFNEIKAEQDAEKASSKNDATSSSNQPADATAQTAVDAGLSKT